jgi:hypothetical protein
MSSLRRIQSSRANGAKSRGPVTPAGRHKSAYNNLRHGILAETVVLEDENSDAFNEIFAALKSEFDPQTEAQLGLVETMAASRWRLMRIWSLERQTLQSEIAKHDPATHEPAARAARAFHDLANNSRTLDVIGRYETRFDRQYARSLNLLLKLMSENEPPACDTPELYPLPAAEGGNLAPEPSSPTQSPDHAEPPQLCQTNPVPQTDTAPEPSPSSASFAPQRLCGELSLPQSQDFKQMSDYLLTPLPKAG